MKKSSSFFSLGKYRVTYLFSILLILIFSSSVNAVSDLAVIANSPVHAAVRVPLDVQPTATVNKDIYTLTIYGFSLKNTATGRVVHSQVSYEASTRLITLTPSSSLDEYTNYTASIVGVTSLDGETLDPAYSWSFRSQDRTAPVISSSDDSGLYITKLDVVLSCNDGTGSGCAVIHYTQDGTEPTINSPVYSTSILFDEGVHTLKYFAIDNEGNKSEIQIREYTVDLTPPEVITPTIPNNNATEINVKSVISFAFSEAVRAETVNVSTITVDNGIVGDVSYDALTYRATYTPKERLTCNTSYTVTVKKAVTDIAGNRMSNDYSWTFNTTTDCIDPVVSISTQGGVFRQRDLTTYLSCTDNQSGCRQIVYTVDGSTPSFEPLNGVLVDGTNTETILFAEGNTTLRYLAEDNAGNLSAELEQVYSLSTQGFLYVGTDDGIGRGVGPEADDFVFSWKHSGAVNIFYDELIGRLYLGAREGVFYSDDLGLHWTFRGLDHPWSSARRAPVAAIHAEGSKVYVATQADLRISHDGLASNEPRNYDHGIDSNYLRDVVANGRFVYAATRKGVAISDNKGQTFITKGLESGLNSIDVKKLSVDGLRIFVVTNSGLSISLDGGESFINRTTADGLASDFSLSDVFVEGSKVYVATGAGISISSDGGQSFVTRTSVDGLVHDGVMAVYAKGNAVYAGTSRGLSISYDGGQSFITRTTRDGLPNDIVRDVLEVNGKLFVVTYSGVSVSDDGGNSFHALGLPGRFLRSIIPRGNTLYISSSAGLLISYDGGVTFELRNVRDGLGDNVITDMHVTPDNKIYVGTTSGLSYSTDGGATFNTYSSELRLPTDDVHGTFVNEQGTMFATTSWGLAVKRAKGGKWFRRRTTDDGLAANYLGHIDGINNVLYVASSQGLSVSYDGGETFVSRTTSDGLGSNNIGRIYATDSAVYVSANGLYVSYDNGQTFSRKDAATATLGISGYGNYLYTAGYELHISTDGGETFTIRDHNHGLGDSLTSIWSGNYMP